MSTTDRDLTEKELSLAELQTLIAEMYSSKDEARGVEGTFMWLMEEVGELSAALREVASFDTPGQTASDTDREVARRELGREFADVLAWLATIANVVGIDLGQAVIDKYGTGCPGCGRMVCECDDQIKP